MNDKHTKTLERKASAFDKLETFASSINYGGRPLRWDAKPGSLLKAIEESDAEFNRNQKRHAR